MPIERRALLLIRTAALTGFLALSAGLFAVYSARVCTFSQTISDPFNSVLKYIQWAPLWAVGLYAVLALWGVRNQRAALLFSLSLPAAAALPVLLICGWIIREGNPLGLFFIVSVIYPATWIMPFVAMMQLIQLGYPKREVGWVGCVFALLIAGVYIWTAIINDFMISAP
jgi:hypothetical protein